MRCPPTEPVGGVLLDLGAATEILRFAQNDRGGQMTGRGECDGGMSSPHPGPLPQGEREEEGERPGLMPAPSSCWPPLPFKTKTNTVGPVCRRTRMTGKRKDAGCPMTLVPDICYRGTVGHDRERLSHTCHSRSPPVIPAPHLSFPLPTLSFPLPTLSFPQVLSGNPGSFFLLRGGASQEVRASTAPSVTAHPGLGFPINNVGNDKKKQAGMTAGEHFGPDPPHPGPLPQGEREEEGEQPGLMPAPSSCWPPLPVKTTTNTVGPVCPA